MFYLQYAARNLWRSRRWSAFAVFSIAAGVATIVALRSLGLAIGDSLTSNLRATNHGDFTINESGAGGFAFKFADPEDEDSGFSDAEVAAVKKWVDERGGAMTAYILNNGVQIAVPGSVTAGRPQFTSSIFIDPATYPPSHEIIALDPPGVPLSELFNGSNEVVISKNMADNNKMAVGDRVRVSGTEEEFVITGIVSADHEAGFRNIFAAFFGFAYFDLDSAPVMGLDDWPNAISLTLPDNLAPQTIDDAEAIEDQLRGLLRSRGWQFMSVPELRQENQQIADLTGDFIVVMGLGAMLIGGVGIVNTMLVMVRRRTEEIAALKTFGLKARQIAALFMSEALLLGLAGSLLGSLIGILLSRLANAYGETLIQQSLAWRIQPEALLFGIVIGVLVSVVFGVMPVLTAVRIRPNIILRPNETHIPRAGVIQSILGLLFIVLALGLIAGQIIGSPLIGIIGTAVTLALLGILILILWVVVWLVGRAPSFGNVDLRLALRNLRARRLRTATTLLALSAGMFALSSIAFFGQGARQIMSMTLSGTLGGNVMIFSVIPAPIANPLIDSKLDSLEGVTSRTRILTYNGRITAIDGQPVDSESTFARRREIMDEMEEAGENADFNRIAALAQELDNLPDYAMDISVRDTTGTNISGGSVTAGRNLTPDDIGKPVLLLREGDFRQLSVPLGTMLTMEVDGRSYDFELVGVQAEASMSFGEAAAPPDVIAGRGEAGPPLTLAQVEPEHLDNALLELSSLPLIYSIDISFIDGLIGRFINQFSALPILVGLLSLGAAAVIMANTVALATLERRRQIGILKAVGLKGRRVLGVMLLENILISLLGGLLGVGLSALGVFLMSYFGIQTTILIPTDSTPIAIALILAAVGIGAAATFASAQVAIQERALNVLRYE
jgi:ABC-type antimicrobial peptide transport system permease subunit